MVRTGQRQRSQHKSHSSNNHAYRTKAPHNRCDVNLNRAMLSVVVVKHIIATHTSALPVML
jgi:hypothetical protein